jgi:hypothetical protein
MSQLSRATSLTLTYGKEFLRKLSGHPSFWETIAHCIPSKYEKYSIELLKAIIELWITLVTC